MRYLVIIAALFLSPESGVHRWGYAVHDSRLPAGYAEKISADYGTICITGYKLNRSGKIISFETALTKKFIALAASGRIRLIPLVTFTSVSDGIAMLKDRRTLKSGAGCAALLAEKNYFAGIHLDFEYLPPEFSDEIADFAAEVKSRLGKKSLTVALFPQLDFPEKISRLHDYAALSKHVDEAVIMCYDYRNASTAPGPVTDIGWAEKNIIYALKYFRPEQVWLGIPAYGYRWPAKGKGSAISSKAAAKRAAASGSSRHESGCVKIISPDGSIIYFADNKTRAELNRLAAEYRLKGTALWRLGFE